MSWFSDLAKGAEALLEKVDQSTASALQKDTEASRTNFESSLIEENGESTVKTLTEVNNADFTTPRAQSLPSKLNCFL